MMLLKDSIIPKAWSSKKNGASFFFDNLARKAVINTFEKFRVGRLTMREGSQVLSFGEETQGFPVSAEIQVINGKLFSEIAAKGLNGAAEAYVRGWWTCDDLTALVRIFVRNRNIANSLEGGLATVASRLFALQHTLRRNTRDNSLLNISAHYDLGNEFFSAFLDETRMYSAAIFQNETESLEEASVNKIDRICQKLELSDKDHVLEIGTGWGGFALHAARNYGCQVTTTTISQKQYEYARQQVRKEGLDSKIKVIQQDYRDLTGRYDKLVSIEMIEAVGFQYFDQFFQKCSDLLQPDGRILLQGIIIVDNLYEEAKRFSDFIKTYIFPGSCIPSISALCNSAAKTTDMRLFHLEDITPHYARTLRLWRERFLENVNKIRDLGFSDEFIRLWIFYFCYCEGGFMERQIGDVQMIFTKPLCRMEPILPTLNPVYPKKQVP